MHLKPGAIVAGYRIVRVLGAGGMGTVYLAAHPSLPRYDALKILSPDLSTNSDFRRRFTREADLAATLSHPNIVSVFDRGEDRDRLWIAMHYVDGSDAQRELERGPVVMPPDRALRIIGEIAGGLDYAHDRGLLHRDVKPANFLLENSRRDDERVLLTDFGVAKSVADDNALTEAGKVLATFAYASPEQLTGNPIDRRADVYALGCSMFHLLTGRHPYPSTAPAVVVMGHLQSPPPRPSDWQATLPRALDDVVARALAKNPADRFANCRELATAARAAFDRTSPVPEFRRTASTTPRNVVNPPGAGGRTSRRRLIGGVAAGVLLSAAAAGTVLFHDNQPTEPSVSTAQVRAEHPEFDGKTITAVNMTDGGEYSAVLDPSQQANFLRDIGFRYNAEFRAGNGESSPRTVSSADLFVGGDVVLIVRTDDGAANGGLRGVPAALLNSATHVAVLDNPTDVEAFRRWPGDASSVMIEALVPILAKAIR